MNLLEFSYCIYEGSEEVLISRVRFCCLGRSAFSAKQLVNLGETDETLVLPVRMNRKLIQLADILLVQPDGDVASYWRDSLLDFGMTRVRVVTSGVEALETVQSNPPSGLVVALPVLADAFALMGALSHSKESRLRDVPILLVARQPSRATLLTATHAGFDVVLTEPVAPRQIYRRVASMIQRARIS